MRIYKNIYICLLYEIDQKKMAANIEKYVTFYKMKYLFKAPRQQDVTEFCIFRQINTAIGCFFRDIKFSFQIKYRKKKFGILKKNSGEHSCFVVVEH